MGLLAGRELAARDYNAVPDSRIEPDLVVDRTVDLDGVTDSDRAMNDLEALKVMTAE